MQKLKISSLVVFGLSLVFVFFFQFCKHAPGVGIANPFAEDPYDAVGSFGIQLAVLAALLTLGRVFRPYPQKEASPAQIRLALRGGMVTLLAVAATLAADAVGLVREVVTRGSFPAAGVLFGLVGGMVLLTVAAGWAFARTAGGMKLPFASGLQGRVVLISGLAILALAVYPLAWRNSGVPGGVFTAFAGMVLLFIPVWAVSAAVLPADDLGYEDVFDDLAVIVRAFCQRLGLLAKLPAWSEKVRTFEPAHLFFSWLNPRRHRWNLVILSAVMIGLLLFLVQAFGEGMPGNLGRVLLVAAVYTGLEGAGVVTGYILLREYLGIFRLE